jgi:predicted N-acyltransferase
MKHLLLLIFFFSSTTYAINSAKAIAIDRLWKQLEETSAFSFSVVDGYRLTLPEASPIRKALSDNKNFKLAQIFVKSEFVTFVDANFDTREIRYLASVYKNDSFRKFHDFLKEMPANKDTKEKLKVFVEENLILKAQ